MRVARIQVKRRRPGAHSGRSLTAGRPDLSGVDRRPVARLRDRLACLAGSGEPGLLCHLHLGEGFLGRRAERRACLEVGDVGDVAAVLLAVEDIDVVVAQRSTSRLKAYRSTSRRNWRIWYGFASPRTSCRLRSSGTSGWTKMWWLPLVRRSSKPNDSTSRRTSEKEMFARSPRASRARSRSGSTAPRYRRARTRSFSRGSR